MTLCRLLCQSPLARVPLWEGLHQLGFGGWGLQPCPGLWAAAQLPLRCAGLLGHQRQGRWHDDRQPPYQGPCAGETERSRSYSDRAHCLYAPQQTRTVALLLIPLICSPCTALHLSHIPSDLYNTRCIANERCLEYLGLWMRLLLQLKHRLPPQLGHRCLLRGSWAAEGQETRWELLLQTASRIWKPHPLPQPHCCHHQPSNQLAGKGPPCHRLTEGQGPGLLGCLGP